MALNTEGKERPARDTDHSRLVSDRFNERGNLYTSLSGGKMKRSWLLPARILEVYIEAFTGFSPVSVRIVSATALSRHRASLKMAPLWECQAELKFSVQHRA